MIRQSPDYTGGKLQVQSFSILSMFLLASIIDGEYKWNVSKVVFRLRRKLTVRSRSGLVCVCKEGGGGVPWAPEAILVRYESGPPENFPPSCIKRNAGLNY